MFDITHEKCIGNLVPRNIVSEPKCPIKLPSYASIQNYCLTNRCVYTIVSIKYGCSHAFNYGKTVGWSGRLGWVHVVKFKAMNNNVPNTVLCIPRIHTHSKLLLMWLSFATMHKKENVTNNFSCTYNFYSTDTNRGTVGNVRTDVPTVRTILASSGRKSC